MCKMSRLQYPWIHLHWLYKTYPQLYTFFKSELSVAYIYRHIGCKKFLSLVDSSFPFRWILATKLTFVKAFTEQHVTN